MKCFVTGITGFIGLNLARHLATNGHNIHATIRGDIPASLANMPGIRFFRGGLHDQHFLEKAMQDCDVVFHLAAYAKPWAKDPMTFHRVNVEGAVNIFNAALQAGVGKVVFTSSAATISPSLNGAPSNEDTHRTVPFFNAYESTKAEAEDRAREFCGKGLQVIIVNPSRVYGPGPLNPSNSVTKMIAGYRKGNWRIIPGDGKKMGNYVFIDDVVHGHLLAAQHGRPGERYILGGENITFDELFEVLGRVTGISRRMVHLPVGIMSSAARMMEIQSRLTGIAPAITVDFVKKYMNHWSLSSDKAIRELGYQITSFSEGVRKTMEWLTLSRDINMK